MQTLVPSEDLNLSVALVIPGANPHTNMILPPRFQMNNLREAGILSLGIAALSGSIFEENVLIVPAPSFCSLGKIAPFDFQRRIRLHPGLAILNNHRAVLHRHAFDQIGILKKQVIGISHRTHRRNQFDLRSNGGRLDFFNIRKIAFRQFAESGKFRISNQTMRVSRPGSPLEQGNRLVPFLIHQQIRGQIHPVFRNFRSQGCGQDQQDQEGFHDDFLLQSAARGKEREPLTRYVSAEIIQSNPTSRKLK